MLLACREEIQGAIKANWADHMIKEEQRQAKAKGEEIENLKRAGSSAEEVDATVAASVWACVEV